jgi:hypothetical protein
MVSPIAYDPSTTVNFVVKNVSSRSLKVFNVTLKPGSQLDLMSIPGITEDDVRAMLLKGFLKRMLADGRLIVLSSSLEVGQNVVNIAALTAINVDGEADFAERRVLSLHQSFQLDKNSSETVNGISVVATNSGVGRWVRVLSHSPKWTNQVAWAVDSVAGNDENVGDLANPLKTMAEFTRRIRVAKYGTGFGPYTIQLLNDVPNTDSFQWSPVLESVDGSFVNSDPDAGVTSDIVVINGSKVVIGTGTVNVFTAPAGNNKCTISRSAGVFALNDVCEFTFGSSNGKRFYPESAGATTTINPKNLGGTVPAHNDTFNIVRLTKLAVQLTGSAQTQSVRMLVQNCWIPGDGNNGTFADVGAPQWEVTGMILRLNNCLVNQFIRPGLAGRAKFGGGSAPSAVICNTLGNYTIERGECITYNTSWVNVLVDVTTFTGKFQMGQCEFLGGGIRMGAGDGEIEDTGHGTNLLGDETRSFDAPAVFPANPYIGTGGVDGYGGALVMMRGARGTMGGGWVGLNPLAASALNISRASILEIGPGPAPTVTGVVAITVDKNAPLPYLDVNGLPVTGQVLTSWADFNNASKFNKNVMNLANGTTIYTSA